ncbi:MAG: hypothetical protein ACI9GH_000599, partial [Candidatus Paceibacteria bacterium]
LGRRVFSVGVIFYFLERRILIVTLVLTSQTWL